MSQSMEAPELSERERALAAFESEVVALAASAGFPKVRFSRNAPGLWLVVTVEDRGITHNVGLQNLWPNSADYVVSELTRLAALYVPR